MTSRTESLVEGRDYYCGTCAGHHVVACEYCVWGEAPGPRGRPVRCDDCAGTGLARCPQCQGGDKPVPPPL